MGKYYLKIGEMITKINVTQGIYPEVLTRSNYAGHWVWGAYETQYKTTIFKSESDVKLSGGKRTDHM